MLFQPAVTARLYPQKRVLSQVSSRLHEAQEVPGASSGPVCRSHSNLCFLLRQQCVQLYASTDLELLRTQTPPPPTMHAVLHQHRMPHRTVIRRILGRVPEPLERTGLPSEMLPP